MLRPARALLALLLVAGCRAAPFEGSHLVEDPGPELVAVIDELYDAFCFDPGGEPDWAAQRRVFLPGASFVPSLRPDRAPQAVDLEQFLAEFREFVASEPYRRTGFHERVVGLRVEVFGDLAQAMVAFEGFEPGDGVTKTRGLDGLQLVHDGERWRVAAFATQFEREGLALPPRFVDADHSGEEHSGQEHPG